MTILFWCKHDNVFQKSWFVGTNFRVAYYLRKKYMFICSICSQHVIQENALTTTVQAEFNIQKYNTTQ